MAAYVLRRLLLSASVVVVVSLAAFAGFGLSLDPSYPLWQDPRMRAVVQAAYHLQDPILVRYGRWATGFLQHGFGTTVSTDVGGFPPHLRSQGAPIGPALLHASAITAALVGLSLLVVLAGSTLVGSVGAQRRRFRADVGTRALAYVGAAVPTFLIADLLRRVAVPHQSTLRIGNNYYVSTHNQLFEIGPPSGGVAGWLRHLALPALALAVGLVGVYARYVRSAMAVELGRPYVTVARAKGLPESRVFLHHALRNSLVPVASLLTLDLGGVVGASLAADGVFRSGGLASVFLGALGAADPFQLTAIVVMSAVVVCGFTFVGDLLVAVLDPRLRTATPSRG